MSCALLGVGDILHLVTVTWNNSVTPLESALVAARCVSRCTPDDACFGYSLPKNCADSARMNSFDDALRTSETRGRPGDVTSWEVLGYNTYVATFPWTINMDQCVRRRQYKGQAVSTADSRAVVIDQLHGRTDSCPQPDGSWHPINFQVSDQSKLIT